MISIVMLTRNRFEMLKYSIELLRQQFKSYDYEIMIVNTESGDSTTEWLLEQDDLRVCIIQPDVEGYGWAKLINIAFKFTQGEWVFMLSDDTFICPGLAKSIYDNIETVRDDVGLIAFPFHDLGLNPVGKYKVFSLWDTIVLNHGLYRRSALEEVGYADEEAFKSLYAADSDLCFAMYDKGWTIVVASGCLLIHDVRSSNHAVSDGSITNKIVPAFQVLIDKWRKIGKFVPDTATGENTYAVGHFIDGDMPNDVIARLNLIAEGK